MTTAVSTTTSRVPRTANRPGYVHHPSFDEPGAAAAYADTGDPDPDAQARYMPDEVTRDQARRMHYAAHRLHRATTPAAVRRWRAAFVTFRDRIVLGNRKLVYRAVRRRAGAAAHADDLIGECHIVLIQAVAAYNPWIGVRFSTYAYTCLVRAMARLGRRQTSDILARALSFEALPDGEPHGLHPAERASSGSHRLDEFLRADHPLLSDREKQIIARRFSPAEGRPNPTLEQVGRALGLSKERVRQVQLSALEKLRKALAPAPAATDETR